MKLFGRKPAPPPSPASLTEDAVRQALSQVMDPEIGINIVDLGLIHALEVSAQRIGVTMTLTSPTCPMGDLLLDSVEDALRRLAPAAEVALEVVWDPPWSADRMSPAAKARFGWDGTQP